MREWTEGVTHAIRWPFLRRNMPKDLLTEEQYSQTYLPQWNEDGLIVRICANNYHLLYDAGTSDWWVHDEKVRRRGLRGAEQLRKERKQKFEDKFVTHPSWMDHMNPAQVEEISLNFKQLVGDAVTKVESPVTWNNGSVADEARTNL